MFLLKPKEEVFVTNNPETYAAILRVLRDGDIHYTTKTSNSGSTYRGVGSVSPTGTLGEDISLSILYYIYTAPKDSEKARHLIYQWQKSS